MESNEGVGSAELCCAGVGAQAVTGFRSQDGLSVMGFHASGHRKVTGTGALWVWDSGMLGGPSTASSTSP